MAHVLQVGAGSGGMPVLDMLCQDPLVTRITIIEPDTYRAHNVERHLLPISDVGRGKAELARRWINERRPDLEVSVLPVNLLDATCQGVLEELANDTDLGICAADNEMAKYHWDALMRRYRKPWTLGEVLSGGIGGFVHWFAPSGPCYGCVAGFLQRSISVEKEKFPDYSQPSNSTLEIRIPASKASIQAIASLHALVTLGLLKEGASYAPGFTSLLLTLQRVPDVFDEPFRPYRFRIPRSPDCLICREESEPDPTASSRESLDAAMDKALARLGHA